MRSGHKRPHAPEDQELAKKRHEFQTLERHLARFENELDDLREDIREFELIYEEKLAERIAELDSLRLELVRTRSEKVLSREEAAWSGAERKVGDRETHKPPPVAEAPVPPGNEGLRDLYRRLAKKIHPDLSRGETERRKRQQLMAEANRAYAENNREMLHAILDEWELCDGSIDDIPESELEIMNRRIDRILGRIRSVENEINRLKGSELYRLLERMRDAKRNGRDIIAEMAARLDADIRAACSELNRASMASQDNGNPPAGDFRVIQFPPDRIIGTLYIRERESRSFLDWQKLGDAVGNVVVPRGKSLRLDVRHGAANLLASLDGIGPHDLQACFLYGVKDDELANLNRIRNIDELYLSGPDITSVGIAHLLNLGNLTRLYLYDTSVADAGLVCLEYLPRLKFLTLSGARITDAGVNSLKQALPLCRIDVLNRQKRQTSAQT